MGVYLGQSVYNDSQVTKQFVLGEIAKNGKGVFFATHGQTTFQSILQEYNNGKIIVCKYQPVTPGEVTTYYLNLFQFNTETFEFVGVTRGGTIYRTSINANEGWENVTTFIPEEIFIATYNVTSYADILAAYNANKFILTKYAIPNTNYTIFAPLTFKGVKPFYFELIDRRVTNQKIQMSIGEDGIWNYSVSSIVTVDLALDSSSHNPVENMAIAAELTAINNKITGDLNDIFLALASKGVTVPTGAGLDDVAGLIDDISSGGVNPIPSGYKRITGIKGQHNSAGNPFKFDNLYDVSNEDLESISLVYIEPITAAPYSSDGHQETQILCPFADLYFRFFYDSWYGSNQLTMYGTNGGDNYNSQFSISANQFGGMKTLSYKNSTLVMDGTTYNIDSRVYAKTQIHSFNQLFGKWSSNNSNTDVTIYDVTVKQNDAVIAHFIPVMDIQTLVPRFYDEITGNISTSDLSDADMINQFTILP